MKGIELARRFYTDYGKALIEENFSEYIDRITVGLAGEGSECFGFDDNISTDHDFEPAFCIWLSREDYNKFGFELERNYQKLPKEYEGLARLGGNRHGVLISEDFYLRHLGVSEIPTDIMWWFYISPQSLAVSCNGEIFKAADSHFMRVRTELQKGYPRDVLLKKLAAHLIMMTQSGLYNYERSVKRTEVGAAGLCVSEFVKNTISAIHLLNNAYEPFYKWSYRSLRSLPKLSELEKALLDISSMGNSPLEASQKSELMLEICEDIVKEIKAQGFTGSDSNDIEHQAFAVQNEIRDNNIRNMHIMDGI